MRQSLCLKKLQANNLQLYLKDSVHVFRAVFFVEHLQKVASTNMTNNYYEKLQTELSYFIIDN